jgi:biotin-(acetyl-CoA carboxylase) ligase
MNITYISLDSIPSTQLYAKRHASTFAENGITCIVAEEQTAGKGRFQRE